MNKIGFYILFWIFISLYVFDYFIDEYSLINSIAYTAFEVIIYSAEFYINLFLLIPFVLQKKGKTAYILSLIVLLSVFCSAYFLTGLNAYLLSENVFRAISSFFLNHSLFVFLSYTVWYYNRYISEKQKRLKLEYEKLQSEMMLLKSQVSPHFLFNALNNIYSLALLKSDDAPKMISTLSDILRYFLDEGNKKEVFLESEIEIISKYIQIQKYRQIPGMNNIIFKVSGDPLGLKVPPLLFMTLIENAFKHGDIIEKKEGFVNIGFNISGKKIEFNIVNSFQPKENRSGIGLMNVKSQLDILYGKNYQMSIDEKNKSYNVSLNLYGN
jgi:LytS/YehU family sensor histidine kinase